MQVGRGGFKGGFGLKGGGERDGILGGGGGIFAGSEGGGE